MKLFFVTSALVVSTLLAACATTQPAAHDDADRLFLKYLEIAQRPSPATIEDELDLATQAKRLSEGGDPCLLAKNRSILDPYLMATLTIDKNDANWPQASAEGRQILRKLQKTPMPSGCAGHEFPQVKID
ncbi:MAG TPA: hypothetical protein VM659_11130 [Dongiaceae bacterium]|nr:hypothetical protein [Dongiaceae bacterium]